MKQVFSGRGPFIAVAAVLALALTACGTSEAPDCGGLKVERPWVRVAPAGADVMAAYFTLINTGDSEVIVNGASSSQFDRAEMHETIVNDNGQASMHPLGKVAIDAGDTVEFKPGGRHVMLFEPGQTYAAGDQVEVILACGSEHAELPVAAVVRIAEPGKSAGRDPDPPASENAGSEESAPGDESPRAPATGDSNAR